MARTKIKSPQIDLSSCSSADNDNYLGIDSNGKLKVSGDTSVSSGNSSLVTSGGVYTALADTSITSINNASGTQTINITPAAKRFLVTQSDNCTYTLTPSQAGLIFEIRITKTSGKTVAFDSNVTLDQSVNSSWTDCTIVFTTWATNSIRGNIIEGS